MYAGGRFTFPGALAYGRLAEKRTTIASITEKSGRSGRLAFVTVRHEFIQDGQVATTEEHDIVYREAAEPGALVPPAPRATALDVATREIVTPDPVLLFCFSALTFNGHRIHYDQPYVTGTEGYPGLVVHGPLVAILLFEKARRDYPGARPSGFSFRAMSPVFCGSEVHLVGLGKQGDAAPYEARTADDTLIMTSTIDFA
jgi:3-methylfumaryl-CoA hydratase